MAPVGWKIPVKTRLDPNGLFRKRLKLQGLRLQGLRLQGFTQSSDTRLETPAHFDMDPRAICLYPGIVNP